MVGNAKNLPNINLPFVKKDGQVDQTWYRYLRNFSQEALTGLAGVGYVVSLGTSTLTTRTILPASSKILITDGNGVDADTTIDVDESQLSFVPSQFTLDAESILANPTGVSASAESVTLGATLAFSGTALQTTALSGDVTSAANSFVTTIANNAVTTVKILDSNVTTDKIADEAVTYAKIQDVSATDKVLGRSTAGSGIVEEIACTAAGRALIDDSTAEAQRTTLGLGGAYSQGDMLYGSGSNTLSKLAKDTNATRYLSNTGTSNDPAWAQVDLTNGVTGTLPIANGGSGGTSLPVIQRVSSQTGAVSTGTTALPSDDTVPQNTEGNQYLTLAITPTNAAYILVIDIWLAIAHSSANNALTAALFQDSTANALAAIQHNQPATGGHRVILSFRHIMIAGTTSSTTFNVRAGGNTGSTTTFNGTAGGRLDGGVMASSIMITEYAA